MAYPWAGLGSVQFRPEERALDDSDWNYSPSYERTRALGTAIDSIVTTAIGSAERTVELNVEPSRFVALKALINTAVTFVDWDRPTPGQWYVFVANVRPVNRDLAGTCTVESTHRKIRVRVELIKLS